MPSPGRTQHHDPEQLDITSLLGDGADAPDPDAVLAEVNTSLQERYTTADDHRWAASPYGWIRLLPTVRKAKAGAALAAAMFSRCGLLPGPAARKGVDFSAYNQQVKVRVSTVWDTGQFVFQHVTPPEADQVLLLGVAPERLYVWLVPVPVMEARSTDPAWFSVDSHDVPDWLSERGGTWSNVLDVVRGWARA